MRGAGVWLSLLWVLERCPGQTLIHFLGITILTSSKAFPSQEFPAWEVQAQDSGAEVAADSSCSIFSKLLQSPVP